MLSEQNINHNTYIVKVINISIYTLSYHALQIKLQTTLHIFLEK